MEVFQCPNGPLLFWNIGQFHIMQVGDIILVLIALLLEMIMLLTIWTWSVQRKTVRALLGASVLVLAPVATSLIFRIGIPATTYLAFGGMYILSGLVWIWWKDGIAPNRWNVSEATLAVLATIIFSLSTAAAGQVS